MEAAGFYRAVTSRSRMTVVFVMAFSVALAVCLSAPRITKLFRYVQDAPEKMLGKNTIDCMKSGVIYGTAAMVDGIIQRAEEEMGKPLTVVATGGISKKIVPYCRRKIICDENLTLKGLRLLYEKNKEKEN